MSEAWKSVGAITLFVEDLPAARSFYERVFGRTAAFEDDSSAAFKLTTPSSTWLTPGRRVTSSRR